MRISTKRNLEEAFAGESKAAMKYSIYSEVAEKEGFPNTSKLFKAISYAEILQMAADMVDEGYNLKADVRFSFKVDE